MRQNITLWLGALLAVVLMAVPDVYALGISVNREVPYVSNTSNDYDICFVNSDNSPNHIKVEVDGPLVDYVTLNFPDVLSLPPRQAVCNTYTVKMPPDMKEAGLLTSHITATEISSPSTGSGIQFNILVSVRHRFAMRVPYPGKYLDLSFSAPSVKESEPFIATVAGKSRGTETIRKISGTAQIYDISTKNEVAKLKFTEAVNIKTEDEVRLEAVWDTKKAKTGEYRVTAKIDYDDKSETFEKTFQIGSLKIDVLNYTQEVYNNSVNKFDIILQSNWNDPVDGVYAEITISKGSYVNTFKTPVIKIEPFSRATLRSFWETRNVNTGTYDVKIVVYYAGKTTVKEGKIVVLQSPSDPEKGAPLSVNTLLIVLVVLMAGLNIFWLIKTKLKKQPQEQPSVTPAVQPPIK